MDRSLKAPDKVNVYSTHTKWFKDQVCIDTFTAVSYTQHGFDYYTYKGSVHLAYEHVQTGENYIFLDRYY